MAGNPFDQFDAAPVAGPVYGAPDPTVAFKARDDQRDDVRIGLEQQRLSLAQQEAAARQAKEALELGDKSTKLARAKSDTVANLTDVINKIDQVGGQARAGWLDTGRGGAFVRGLPGVLSAGTDAYNLAANLGKIDATGAFSTLQTMRENSPTGGALGAVSDTELGLLKSSVANLDPNQSEDQFLTNLSEARNVYLRMLEKVDPAAADALRKKMEQEAPPPITDEGGLEVRVTDDSPGGAPPSAPTTPGGGPNSGEGGLMDLAKQGVTLGLADEAAGVGGYLSGFLTGEDPQAAYVRERDAARARVDSARAQYPVLGTAAELLGGGGAARVAGVAGNALGGAIRQGAALGGVGGFGYGEGAQGSVGNAFLGGAVGGGVGGALGLAGRGISNLAGRAGGPPPTAEQLSLIQAGERQGVPVRPADVRPELRNRLANAETTQTGGPIIREARANDANLIEQRVSDIGGQGTALPDNFALGERVQGAGRRYIANTKQQANRLYDRARTQASGATVQPTEAIAAIDQNIAELSAAGENTNAGQIAYLNGLREDLNRPLSIEAVQSLRTNMRGQLSEKGLTGTDAERRVAQVIDAANQDLTRELPQEASNALRAADAFYRERQSFINDTLSQVMGSRGNPVSAETAAQRLVSMTKGTGNYNRFSSMWKQLEPEEQADVAATVASSLGRKANGEFSISTLVRSLDPNKGINPRTARLVFGDDGAQALNDLRALSKAKTDVQGTLNNSRTGTAVNAAAGGLRGLMLGGLGFTSGGLAGGVALPFAGRVISELGEKRAARLLLNPDFTKWLRNAPNTTNPRVIDRYFSRLAGIGSIASNDNQAFVSAVRNSVNQSPGRVAASEQEPDTRREPVQ